MVLLKRRNATIHMASSKPVLFMNTRTPGNFQGKRQQQEVRTLALRAASFARPNRRKKTNKVVPEDSASVSSQEVSVSSGKRSPLPRSRCEVSTAYLLGQEKLVNARSNPQESVRISDSGALRCLFCGSTLEKRPFECCTHPRDRRAPCTVAPDLPSAWHCCKVDRHHYFLHLRQSILKHKRPVSCNTCGSHCRDPRFP